MFTAFTIVAAAGLVVRRGMRAQERPGDEREEDGRTDQLEPAQPKEVAHGMRRDHRIDDVGSR